MHPILKNLNDLEKMGSVSKGSTQEVADSLEAMTGWITKESGGVGRAAARAVDPSKLSLGWQKFQALMGNKAIGGLAAAGVVGGGLVVAGKAEAARLRAQHKEIAKDLNRDPDIKADPQKAKRVYGVMTRYAPGIASDPVVAKATVKSLMTMPESYLTYDVAKKLTEAEKEYDLTHGILAKIKKIV